MQCYFFLLLRRNNKAPPKTNNTVAKLPMGTGFPVGEVGGNGCAMAVVPINKNVMERGITHQTLKWDFLVSAILLLTPKSPSMS